MKTVHIRFDNTLTLQDVAEQLHLNYYSMLQSMCAQAKKRLADVKCEDAGETIVGYTHACTHALTHIENYLNLHRDQLKTYLNDLHNKAAQGHDCNSCKGGCNINHAAHVLTLQHTHADIQKALFELQCSAPPLFSATKYPNQYRQLREEMLVIDIMLRELLHIEEAELLPRIINSQNEIHVRHI